MLIWASEATGILWYQGFWALLSVSLLRVPGDYRLRERSVSCNIPFLTPSPSSVFFPVLLSGSKSYSGCQRGGSLSSRKVDFKFEVMGLGHWAVFGDLPISFLSSSLPTPRLFAFSGDWDLAFVNLN